MNTILITYDLRNTSEDNKIRIVETIKNYSPKWWHYISSTWIIKTEKSVVEMNDLLIELINQDTDRLLVIGLKEQEVEGWLNDKGWNWISENTEMR